MMNDLDEKTIYKLLKSSTMSESVPDTFSKQEWIIRCPYCGDSRKNTSKGHLQVNFQKMIFHCFRCESGGLLWRLLLDCGAPIDIIKDVKIKTPRLTSTTFDDDFTKVITELNYNVQYTSIDQKHKYLVDRLGDVICNREDFVERYRIIYNLKEFANHNNIELPDDTKNKLDWLNSDFIGFGCDRGCKIVMRNIKDSKYRYQVIKLKNFFDIYTIKNRKKLEQIKRNTIVIAEGIFDVLNSHSKNVLDLNSKASAYVSVLSKAYGTAHKLARTSLILPYPTTICLLDNDMYITKNMTKTIIAPEILIYRNAKGKDFGENIIEPVLDSRIKEGVWS